MYVWEKNEIFSILIISISEDLFKLLLKKTFMKIM